MVKLNWAKNYMYMSQIYEHIVIKCFWFDVQYNDNVCKKIRQLVIKTKLNTIHARAASEIASLINFWRPLQICIFQDSLFHNSKGMKELFLYVIPS